MATESAVESVSSNEGGLKSEDVVESVEKHEREGEAATDPDSALISTLLTMASKQPKLVKSSVYSVSVPWPPTSKVQTATELKIRSWKMNEFKYYDVPSPFPTLARGLFTREVRPDEEYIGNAKKYQVVVRGYDKFFNIGEVPWVNVRLHYYTLSAGI